MSTPGRRRRAEDKHTAYNADPKNVGTYTNAPMPRNVERLADGFEDPEAFFKSPTGTNYDGANRTFQSMYNPQTPGNRSEYTLAQTPMTGETGITSLGTIRRSKSRLSDIDIGDNDEEEEHIDDDLLEDEDDLRPATPGQSFFAGNNPPSVTLPSRSRVSASSPAINKTYDSLPSPRATTSAARSPRKSTLSAYSHTTPGRSTRGGRVSDITDENASSPFQQNNGSPDLSLSRNLNDSNDRSINSSPLRNTARKSTRVSTSASPRRSSRLSTSPTTKKTTAQQKKNSRQSERPDRTLDLEEEAPIEQELSIDDADQTRLQDDNDDEIEGDITMENTRRKSMKSAASRKSNATRNGDSIREASISDNEADNGPAYDNDGPSGFDASVQDVSIGNHDDDIQEEDNNNDISALVDDMANGDHGDENDEVEDDVGLEEDAIAEENEEEEEEADRPARPERRHKPATKKRPVKQNRRDENNVPRTRNPRQGSVAPVPKRTRVSQIGVGDGYEDENQYTGNFTVRRSNRQHFAPLEYWRGEKFEYARGPKCPVIKEVITIPEQPAQPLSQRYKKSRSRQRSSSVVQQPKKRRNRNDYDSQDDDDDIENGAQGSIVHTEDGWDAGTEPTGLVKTYPDGFESHRKIACPKALLNPPNMENQSFDYQKVFGEGDFMAAGVVFIPIGSKKATKPSKDNAYVFYVIQGAVQVTIYRTSFVMAPGGQFLVPRGNDYCIENISEDKEVKLFFAQARKIRAGEEETDDVQSQARSSSVVENGKKGNKLTDSNNTSSSSLTTKKKKLQQVREESDNDDDDY
ncbi:uncharacterized protein L201_000908 [Kwoniella dendrophila CBS 6074]|uniref:CENP-C homolog n=1 Tax=Kwoniella dendrophila CBS 6074 TaxID=1295534 RepID=A0AAX4JMK5_9TREE